LAEWVVVDPLQKLGADLDGKVFGFDHHASLNLGLLHCDSMNNMEALIHWLVTKDSGSFLLQYGPSSLVVQQTISPTGRCCFKVSAK
jgi:hypothetical protein